ncbi:hypothetical protein ASC65_10305 [Brevundimonas sp. Root1279]|nr:hypothetical protein ASC65_10305 [Brevundimonas sp. Root1279]
MTVGGVRPRQTAGTAMRLKVWSDGVLKFARRTADDIGGNVAMLFCLAMPVLIMMTFGGVDIHRISTVRVNLQDALDAATLAAARSPYTSDADLKRIGLAALDANLQNYPDIVLIRDQTKFTLVGDVVVADAKVEVKTLVANIVLPPYGKLLDDTLPVKGHSEVDRASRNIEVALALDITGSMAGQKLTDLKAAAKQLVDLVVQPIQTPYYSKVALVPWSNSVNPGSSYLTSVRGSVVGSTPVSNAVMNLVGTAKTITGATKARPVVITSASHGFANNDVVWITGATGMTQLNNKPYVVKNKTTNTFELYTLSGSRVNGENYNAYTGTAGRIQRCQNNDCSITFTTSSNHGLSNNDYVYFTDVSGLRDSSNNSVVNGKSFLVGNVTSTTFTIEPPDGQSITPYASGGRTWCAQAGCTWYAFEDTAGDLQTFQVSSCVTERTGNERYTDASVGAGKVGRHYPSATGECLGNAVVPLSTDKTTLKSRIDNFVATGGTAGQIGIGWGWYMVSPTFSALWGGSGQAGAYNVGRTLKAVVIMTDGEFNTPYCTGVLARNAGSGSGSVRIDCDADNGDPFAQSRSICSAMKAEGVIVYTVGFQIASGGDAAALLEDCASSKDKFFLPATGGDLSEVFAAIGRDITKLRITK